MFTVKQPHENDLRTKQLNTEMQKTTCHRVHKSDGFTVHKPNHPRDITLLSEVGAFAIGREHFDRGGFGACTGRRNLFSSRVVL